jgi:hypothetical protein
VVPKSALTNLVAKQWQKTGSDFCVDFVEVDTIKTARKFAADYTSKCPAIDFRAFLFLWNAINFQLKLGAIILIRNII